MGALNAVSCALNLNPILRLENVFLGLGLRRQGL